MAKRGRYVNTQPTPDNFVALWNRLHTLGDQLTAALVEQKTHADTLTTLQSSLSATDQKARRALIAAGTLTDTPGAGHEAIGGSGGGSPPPPPPPGGTTICSTQPLSTSLPGWLYTALVGAGQTDNCWTPAMEASLEGTFNANDYTIVTGLACSIRGRIEHQGNHGLWGTCGGHPDAQYVADLVVDIVVTNSDGSVSWGWVPR